MPFICETRLTSDPTALVDLTRLRGWMSTCLTRIPEATGEAVEYAQRAAETLAKISDVPPASGAGLREILDQALKAKAAYEASRQASAGPLS